MRDYLIRAASAEIWQAAAIAHRLIVPDGPGWRAAIGVDIVALGSAVLVPAQTDSDGAVIADAVLDPRHHVNLRISGPALSDIDPDTGLPIWQALEAVWIGFGAIAPANAGEVAYAIGGVEIVTLVQTPNVIWAS